MSLSEFPTFFFFTWNVFRGWRRIILLLIAIFVLITYIIVMNAEWNVLEMCRIELKGWEENWRNSSYFQVSLMDFPSYDMSFDTFTLTISIELYR